MKPIKAIHLLAALTLLLLCSCVTHPRPLDPVAVNGNGPSRDVHVVSHGRHTGLIIDAEAMNREIPQWKHQFGEVQYYEIGWGDAGFYRAEKITSRLSVEAIFRPTRSIVHVVGLDDHPAVEFPASEVIRLSIHDANHDNLLRFIALSMSSNDDGVPIYEGPGIYGNSAFYTGAGRYGLFNTCNKWTAKGLYSAGVDVGVATTVSSGDVMTQIRKD